MRSMRPIAATAALMLTLALSLPLGALAQQPAAAAQSGGDHYTESYSLDIRMADFMGRLYDVLTREEWFGQVPEVRGFAEIAKQMGLFNLSTIEAQYTVQNGKVDMHFGERFEGLDPASYYGTIFALPNKPLKTANYVGADNFVVFIGASNLPQHVLAGVNEVGRIANTPGSALSEMMGEDSAELTQALQMVEAFNIEEQVNEVLTGEVALALFEMPSLEALEGDFSPDDLSTAALIGVKDAARLRELAGAFGPQAGLTPMTGDLGGWTGYYIPGMANGGIMFNDDLMVVSPNIHAALGKMDFNRTGMQTPPVQFIADVNLTRMHDTFVGPLMGGLIGESDFDLGPTQSAAAYLFALPSSEQLGHLTLTTAYDNGYDCNVRMNTALANYMFYYLGVGISGMAHDHMGEGGEEEWSEEMDGEGEGE